MKKLDWISWLRGIIALIIVLYHLQQLRPIQNLSEWNWDLYQYFNMFPIVVAVFFILTGLLRSLGYWEALFHGATIPNTRKVILDRWWRIAPVYYIALIFSFFWWIYISWYNFGSLISFFSGMTFLNWTSPMTFFPSIVNGPLWFIWYDMMGYLFTIAMMLGLTRVSRKFIIPMIILYILLFLSLHSFFISLPWPKGAGIASVWFPYYNPFIFALYSIVGMSIGGIIVRYQNLKKNIGWDFVFLLSIVSIFGYIWIIRWASDLAYSYPMSPYRFPLIPWLWAIAIISLIFSRYFGIIMDNRFFLWLASISYSLYLWHGLIIAILLSFAFHSVSTSFFEWSLFSAIVISISFFVAQLSTKYIEGWRWGK